MIVNHSSTISPRPVAFNFHGFHFAFILNLRRRRAVFDGLYFPGFTPACK